MTALGESIAVYRKRKLKGNNPTERAGKWLQSCGTTGEEMLPIQEWMCKIIPNSSNILKKKPDQTIKFLDKVL